jgi:pimeloyl-ACP methyl ester carboxylesterase
MYGRRYPITMTSQALSPRTKTVSAPAPAPLAAPDAASHETSTATSTRPPLRATLWAACTAFVPLVAIAVVAVAAVPHVRGIEFVTQLRYALLAPACVVAALAAAFGYQAARGRSEHPRRILAAGAFAAAVALLIMFAVAGPPGLAPAAAPMLLVSAGALTFFIPRAFARTAAARPRGLAARLRGVAIVLGAGLEIAGAIAAARTETKAAPDAGGLAFDVPRAQFDADHRFLTLRDGARVHYVDVGRGPTLLFLHGNPAWSFQWRQLIGKLSGSARCVALDYPGFGLSTAAPGTGLSAREQSVRLEEFVDRLGLRDLTLVMQDWGGPIGLGLAGRRPELVRRIVVGNTWAWPTRTGTPRGLFSKIAGGPLGEFVQMNFNGFAKLALGNDTGGLPDEVMAVYLRPFQPLAGRRVAAFYPGQITAAAVDFVTVEAGLARVADRPALIIWGLRDPGFPPADRQRFEAAFPNHRTITLPDAGHFFFEGHATEVADAIAAFIAAPAGG